jgi:tetratricopeptide (TPR) repeat protein
MVACRRGKALGGRWIVAVLLAVAVGAGEAAPAAGQGAARAPAVADTVDPLTAALDAEDRGDRRAAAAAYRRALKDVTAGGGDRVAIALLGLERVWAELGWRDSIAPVVEELLLWRPADPVARSIQLRTLFALDRPGDAHQAYLAWRRGAPHTDPAPFREYARQLLERGRTQAADSVLADAARALGGSGALAAEAAQLHVALGRWPAAAAAYRQTLDADPYLEAAALFALRRTPAPARDSVRLPLQAPPLSRPARRVLASLELAWGEPRRGWLALAPLAGDDSVAATWRDFAERTELAESWLVARDVWQALLERGGGIEARLRGAEAALRGGDPEGALRLVRVGGKGGGSDSTRRLLVPLEVEALAALGRADEAQRVVDALGATLDDDLRRHLARPLVSAYLQRGDVARARAVLEASDLQDDDETVGWLALYEGDLTVARQRLVRAGAPRPEVVDALGILARVRGDGARGLGAAFLALARRDSTQAATRFEALADSVGDGAAPALLALAARLRGTRGDALWLRIRERYPASPEAAEALLAMARAQRAAGHVPAAITQLEALILEHPDSALLPQARRLLDELRGRRPPA